MAVENNVNVQSATNQYQSKVDTKAQNKGNPNAVDKTPEKDTVQLSSGLTTKEKVGIGAAIATGIALITLAVLGRNGHLGEGVQKFLGGKAKKAAQEMGEHTHTPKPPVESKAPAEPKAPVEQKPNVRAEQEAESVAQEGVEHIKTPTGAQTTQATEYKMAKDIIDITKIEDPIIKKALDKVLDVDLIGQASVPTMIEVLDSAYYLEIIKNLAKTESPQELSKVIQELNKKLYNNIPVGELPKEFEARAKINFDKILQYHNEQLSKIGKQISFPENATPSEKIGILMTAGLEEGRNRAMKTVMPRTYNALKEGLAQNQDVSILYDGIKRNLNKAIEFIS